jgi:two-component system, NtrC family, sensor kinase
VEPNAKALPAYAARGGEGTSDPAGLARQLEIRTWALDAAPTHFFVADMTLPGWPIIFVNRALARDTGYRPEELLGQSISALVAVPENASALAEVESAMRRGAPARAELRARRRDGSIFWMGVTLSPMRDSAGVTTHYVSVGADITARLEEAENRNRLQRQLYEEMQERERMAIQLRFAQKLESVGRLAAGIAHEINTPAQYVGDSVRFLQEVYETLGGLFRQYREVVASLPHGTVGAADLERLGAAEAAADLDFLEAEAPRAFERTLDGIGRIADIVRAMKEFAHPDMNDQILADINHAIETTLTVARSEYRYCATIVTQWGELPEVLCNAGELNQVFLNLIVNAAHAIQQAGKDATLGRIEISTAVDAPFVTIEIADNGCGIAQEHVEKIFDPFFTTKEVGKGTGQGLAIARAIIVDKHAGSIEVRSTVGVGTRFVLRLPIGGRNSGEPA